MRTGSKILMPAVCAIGFVSVLALAAYDKRYVRKVAFEDLSRSQTQTVSVAFQPTRLRWKMRGKIHGSGTVTISCVLSNRVTGTFSMEGDQDYYDTNALITFAPEGKTDGKIRASLRFGAFMETLP